MQTSTTGSTSRKRPREGETDSQRIKREKAAERQRRKRERDRNAAVGIITYSADGSQQQQAQQAQQQQQAPQQQAQQQQQQHASLIEQGEMTLEEMARRDRVRAAARERQRKHRRMIKERKMRELGLEMGGEMMGPIEEVGYRQGDGQYSQVLHDMQPIPISHEPPFPQTNLIGGQTFASTLLLSFSCAPLLKQHLLRTLNMTNDELASLEPIIAEAWDRWDHQVLPSLQPAFSIIYLQQRRIHYAEHAAKGPPAPPYMPLAHDEHGNPAPFTPNPDPNANEFRARFHRPLVAQPPFRAYSDPQQQQQQQQPPPAPANPPEAIDPHLSGAQPTAPGSAKT